MPLKTSDFDYELPPEFIAQEPVEPRDRSRLLVLHRSTGTIDNRFFYELLEYLRAGDLLVLNDSRVIPARLLGQKQDTGAKAEIMLLRSLGGGRWEALAKPSRRLKKGSTVVVNGSMAGGEKAGTSDRIVVEVLEEREGGIRTVRVQGEEYIEKLGKMPLPPYIHRPIANPQRYQTVYARNQGSVAAPTAGLHFTTELMANLREKGVGLEFITLHVGLDSFRTIKEENPEKHSLHKEYAIISEETAESVNRTRRNGGRVVYVGTTVTRAMEQAALSSGLPLKPWSGWCDILILPGYRFKLMDVLITNFHPPRATQLMLVSAFAGRENVLSAYEEAKKLGYRFLSLGDAMLIL